MAAFRQPVQGQVVFTVLHTVQVDDCNGPGKLFEKGLNIIAPNDQMADIHAYGQIQIFNDIFHYFKRIIQGFDRNSFGWDTGLDHFGKIAVNDILPFSDRLIVKYIGVKGYVERAGGG